LRNRDRGDRRGISRRKRELFARIENVANSECILASTRPSFSITALAAGLKRPERVVGMHFFNPAPLMPLVEVVSGLATSPEALESTYATALAWGKTPVRASSTPGFIVNRCARPFYAEGLRLLAERAADAATLDAVIRDAGGFRMGPFELIDLIGLDVNLAVTTSVWDAYFHDPRYAPSVLQQERVAAGFLGRKAGRGFYDYAPGVQKPEPHAEPKQPAPARVVVHGEHRDAALVERMARRASRRARRADSRFPAGAIHVAGEGGGAWLALTDGRTATARVVHRVRDLVLHDYAIDYATPTRIAVARADTCSDAAYASVVGALQAAGVAVSRLDDVAGLAVMRIVAMLANEAADAVVQGSATRMRSISRCRRASTIRAGPPAGPMPSAQRPSATCSPISRCITAKIDTGFRRSSRAAQATWRQGRWVSIIRRWTRRRRAQLAGRVAASMYARDTATQALGIRVVRVGAGIRELAMDRALTTC
jgi:3-hydroxybutyryl-CoA dehydrogenase